MRHWLFRLCFHGIVVIALLSLVVATWFTWSQTTRASAAPVLDPFSSAVADLVETAQVGVVVAAAIRRVRVVVVDQDEVVQEVWSNTDGPDYDLIVRQGDRWGPDYPATEKIKAQLRIVEPSLVKGVTYLR